MKKTYSPPHVIRYRPPEGAIEQYGIATGAVPSIQCTERGTCECIGRFCSPPPWELPD